MLKTKTALLRQPLFRTALLVWVLSTLPAIGQEEYSRVLEEIIVTAQKRDENLQDIPAAVTAISGEALETNQITDFVELSSFVPGVTVSPAEGGDRVTVSIRGVGQESNQNDIAAPSVSFHSDGVYIVSPFALGASFLDVESIQVVRGPQGTLFGQNSTGGALNVATVQPELGEWSGHAEATVGSFDTVDVTGALNIPVADTFAIRAAINHTAQDGSTRNIFNRQRLDDKDEISWRLKGLWEPSDVLSLTFTVEDYSSDTNGAARFGLYDPTPGERKLAQDDLSSLKLDSSLFSLVAEYSLDFATVKFLGSYQEAEIQRSRDNDFTVFGAFDLGDEGLGALTNDTRVLRRSFEQNQDQNHESLTAELNLVSSEPLFGVLDYVVGVFYFEQDIEALTFERVDQSRVDGLLDPFDEAPNGVVFGIPPFGADVGFQSNFFPSRESYSVYGQGTYSFSDTLRVTAGLRYTDDTASNLNFNFFTLEGGIPTAEIEESSEFVTGTVSVEYDVSDDLLVYGSYTRGAKPGGNNLTFGQDDGVVDFVSQSFRSEEIDAFEVGLKGDFLDKTLRFNASAFYYMYDDLQAQGTDPRNVSSGVINVPESTIFGLETELLWAATDQFTFSGSLTLLDSEITSSVMALDNVQAAAAELDLLLAGTFNLLPVVSQERLAVAQDLDGNELAKTPAVTASFTAQFADYLTPSIELLASLTVTYRDELQSRVFNNPDLDTVPSFVQLNASAELLFGNGFAAGVSAINLTDDDAVASRFTDVFGVYSTFDQKIRPRTVLLSLSKSF